MNANLQQLRREAYRLWGIKPKQVIYNMPLSKSRVAENNFTFQINYADGLETWPKAYAVSLPNSEIIDRIIVPIKIIKKFDDLEMLLPAWYDMPLALNKKMIEIISKGGFYKPLSFWKSFVNFLLPANHKYQEIVPVEKYTFQVYQHTEKTFSVKLV